MNLRLLLIACFLTGCKTGPDYTPVGGGLAVVGLAIVVASIVLRLPSTGKEDKDDEEP